MRLAHVLDTFRKAIIRATTTTNEFHAKCVASSKAVRDGDIAVSMAYLKMAEGTLWRAAKTEDVADAARLVNLSNIYRRVGHGRYT